MTNQSIKSLATSLVFIFLMIVCASLATGESLLHEDGINQLRQSMRWASVISILAGLYYLNFMIWCRCYRRSTEHRRGNVLMRQASPYSDLPQSNDSSSTVSLDDDSISLQSTEIIPELTTENIWVHAYGWGVLIFVTLYCLPGIYMQGACWWCFGMLVLSADELITSEVNGKLVGFICGSVVFSLVSLWWGLVGEDAKNQTLGEIVAGIAGPALVPFAFFSVRSNVRNTVKDIPRLFKFAAPFVIVMAVFILTTMPRTDEFSLRRRALLDTNSSATLFHETLANFSHKETTNNFTSHQEEPTSNERRMDPLSLVPFIAFFMSPIFSGLVMYLATSCAISGHATEFVVALVVNLAGIFCFRHGDNPAAVYALVPAMMAFVLVLYLRKIF
jgi:hypothetical protein